MKAKLPQPVRATLLFGVALLATPAFAQQGQNVTPPPVVPTVPQTETITPSPTVQTAPASPIVQPVPATPAPAAETAAEPPARTTARRTAARTETRTTRTTRTTTRAAPAEARAPVPRPAPVEAPAPVAAPVQSSAGPVAAPAPAPAVAVAPAVAPAPAAANTTPIWPWLAGGALLALAALAFLLFRRRSGYDDAAEVYYEEPVSESIASQPIAVEPFAAPLAAPVTPRPEPVAPRAVVAETEVEPVPAVVAAEDATVVDAESTDLVGMQAGSAPVPQRPWLELGMRPVRAGTMASEALVEVELIVGNAGDMRADNVRISTFMLPGGAATSEMEDLLIERANDTAVSPMTIEPGEGKCVDATLAVSKSAMLAHGDSFSPMIVADARYTLPDGSEGRTSATFRLGLTDEDGSGMEPIGISHGMHDNVVAELEGAPARA